MKITVTSGKGTGPTELAAFDSALADAGVSNYNLIYLSSVVPAKSEITVLKEGEQPDLSGEWGDRLYVVIAEQREVIPNKEAWAGIGWVQDNETGKGLFVEHHGSSEHQVQADITASLKALMKTRSVDFGEIKMKVIGVTCHEEPVCALAVATYQASGW